ncbi:hypothetical protein [Roseomonas indoligenes]|uniref:Uncharacterized protein n=1 Tax=Roseomonas indoligenes TaxID=2820811 RepID=A0A940MR90_9PROT|nr:hypothetical protein [Pararoseomonas indoligenes]MBP0492004.1 hypothetical protein [Pararoseomonas indoligenes]
MTQGLPPGIGPGRPNRLGRTGIVLLTLVTLVAWAPLLSVLFTAAVADALGCRVHEGFPTPCPSRFGDLGELLYTTGVMGWLMLVTGPFMLATGVIWPVLLIVRICRRFRG